MQVGFCHCGVGAGGRGCCVVGNSDAGGDCVVAAAAVVVVVAVVAVDMVVVVMVVVVAVVVDVDGHALPHICGHISAALSTRPADANVLDVGGVWHSGSSRARLGSQMTRSLPGKHGSAPAKTVVVVKVVVVVAAVVDVVGTIGHACNPMRRHPWPTIPDTSMRTDVKTCDDPSSNAYST